MAVDSSVIGLGPSDNLKPDMTNSLYAAKAGSPEEDGLRPGGSSIPRTASQFRKSSIIILACFWFLTQIAGMFSPPLLDDVDGIHMEAAREMALRHDYVTLYVDGIRYLDKPPLPYWLGAFSIHLFGPHDWAVRLTLSLTILILTLYLYWFGTRRFGERAGLYSACAVVTAVGPYIYTRFFIPDVMVALWMTIAADLILRMVETSEREGSATPLQASLFGAVCAAAMLTKGLIGIVFPVGLLIAFLLLTGRLKLIKHLRAGLGTLVFLVAALPWHILAAIRNPASGASRGWFWFYFINEQINRYLNKRIPRDYDKVPLLTFWVLLLVWVLPWGVFLFGAAWEWWKSKKRLHGGGTRTLLCIWALMIVGFFSFSTRQEYYTLPAVPALALLIGAYLGDEEKNRLRAPKWSSVSSGVLFGFGALVAAICIYLAAVSRTPAPGAELYQELMRHPQDYQLSFGHLFDFTTRAFGFFRVPLIAMAVSMLATTGVSFWLRKKNRLYWSNLALAAGMCAVLGCVHLGLTIFYPILGSERLAQAIETRLKPADLIVIDGEYSNGSSINFYTRHPVYMLNGRVNNLWYGSLFADAPHRFEDNASFERLWDGPERVFFVTHNEQRTESWEKQHGGYLIASSSGKFVLSNRQDQ